MKKIAIVGGGLTGLTAGYYLLKSGYQVNILEQEDYLGGLASTIPYEGTHIEKLYHHIFKTDTNIQQLISELGLIDKLVWLNSSVGTYYDGKIYPFVTPMDLLRFKPLSLVDRIRAGALALFLQKYKNGRKLAKYSAYDWMSKYAGKNVVKVIWEPLLRGKFAGEYKNVSMAWLWARVYTRANSKKGIGEKEMLGYMQGGFETLTNALVQMINRLGGEIYTSMSVKKVFEKGGTVNVETDKGNLVYDTVVFTTPTEIYNKICGIPVDEDKNIKYIGTVCGLFSSAQSLGQFYWNNINDIKSPFLVFINHTQLVDKSNYNGKYIYYIGTYLPHDHKYFKAKDEQVFDEWFKFLRKIFPDFDDSLVTNRKLFRFKYAQHVVDPAYELKILPHAGKIKNVYLANFSQIYPEDRGMNFAVREGKAIAQSIYSNM